MKRQLETLFGEPGRLKRLQKQKVGEFIVHANKALTIEILDGGDDAGQKYFEPEYTHQLFGENEQIIGFEGLQISISLSPVFWRPLVKVSYDKKAPESAAGKIDDVEAILRKHYGQIWTSMADFNNQVLQVERSLPRFGEVVHKTDEYELRKVNLTHG